MSWRLKGHSAVGIPGLSCQHMPTHRDVWSGANITRVQQAIEQIASTKDWRDQRGSRRSARVMEYHQWSSFVSVQEIEGCGPYGPWRVRMISHVFSESVLFQYFFSQQLVAQRMGTPCVTDTRPHGPARSVNKLWFAMPMRSHFDRVPPKLVKVEQWFTGPMSNKCEARRT
jgi:hypothetical protein